MDIFKSQKIIEMVIDTSIQINSALEEVWEVFTNPAVSIKMGGFYKTDWKPGAFFGWQNPLGEQITYGRLLEYRRGEFLKHELLSAEDGEVLSIISYSTVFKNGHTVLHATEELSQALSAAELSAAINGWEVALEALKRLAESL